MENASKALIIAGAILLAISIIGIGMYVFTQAKGAVGNIGMDKEKIAAYNADFEAYEGTVDGSSARALCDTVRNHNLAHTDDATTQIVVQTGSAAGVTTPPSATVTAAAVNTIKQGLKQGYNYKVDFGYDANTGLIVAVGITQQP